MGRFNPKTNKAVYESESYGQGVELDNLQDSAEMFKKEVAETQGVPRVQAPATQNFLNAQQGIYTQTNNPGEDVATSQYKTESGLPQVDADMALRKLYTVLQSKDILALMNDQSAAPERN
jgi:RES domain-containing protein|tara:strand:- start:1200 stop:1559 length:360 start_codon:yes stop_codon:yes gene_type:complete